MSTQAVRISDIDNTTSWSIKVIVFDKTQPRHSTSSPRRYQRITFMDSHEQKVVATIYGSDITLFKDTFKIYETYTISNAKVTPLPERYNKFGYPYQWTINRKTAYLAETEEAISRSVLKLQFSSLSNLKNLIGQDSIIDILALVIDKKEKRTLTASGKDHILKEYAIMNQEQSIVILTLWNNVAESEGNVIGETDEAFPIIRATGLAVSPHYGGSLGSTPSTVILVNPQIPEAENLKNWRQKNLKLITEAVSAKDHFTHSDSFLDVPTNKICAIADVVADSRVDRFLVKVQAMITDPDQKYFYMSCEKCFSGVDADFDYPYTCASCKEFTHAKPREKILFSIFDGSGSLDVTAFGKHASELIGMSAISCMELYSEGAPLPLGTINRSLSGQHYIMKIRKREHYMGDSIHHQYVVLSMLLHKSKNSVGFSTASTDVTLSVSRELFPPETVTETVDGQAFEDASGSNDNTNITSVIEADDSQAVEDVIEANEDINITSLG